MKRLSILLVCFVLLLPWSASAQNRFIKHEVFALDSFQTLQLELIDAYQTTVWAGNTLMIKTEIRLYNGSEGILEHFLKEGRYDVKADSVGSSLTIRSVDQVRQTIKTAKGECYEAIDVEIFIPESLIKTEEHHWIKPEEESTEAKKD